ncbi:AMP-binding protein [Acuticoccus sp. M5D2P5]|uniref:AMP-binding protein n=1 Tax=Acuticoccus kalidii TaxID=2910977 RepID=UPI001F453AD8|nr:AMP-binding protein [Acuticoccus kalidii]MCF3933675.1 AMP-binding protein [Acuticoccus kalidii]
MDERGLHRQDANIAAITPLHFLGRTAEVFPDRIAVIHGEQRMSWAELDRRARRLAAGLKAHGIEKGDVVAILCPNTPAFVEANFGVPMADAILLPLNIRLDADTLAYSLTHSEAKMVLVDCEFAGLLGEALTRVETPPTVVRIDDPLAKAPTEGPSDLSYEALFADEPLVYEGPADEWDSFSLSYTSGTTGRPKGVVYSHRGVATTAVSNMVDWTVPRFPVYLWTVPMFHCNGWCFPYTIALMAGTNVCLRHVDPDSMIEAFTRHGVTHLGGAPIVMQMVIEGARKHGFVADRPIRMMTAAAPPPASVIGKMEEIGIEVTQVYGLTETYGPTLVSSWNPDWDGHDLPERARLKARQGVRYSLQAGVSVRDPETLEETPADGETIGEIMMRGNMIMKGYLKDEAATQKAFAGGYFHSGDLAVLHPDRYIEIKDRAKDIIISGGENISSIEVENALYAHPAVASVAVVAMPHERWGETPCAFVELVAGGEADEAGLIAFVRERIAHYKAPRKVVFEVLPKTSTGKIQKFSLREKARALAAE